MQGGKVDIKKIHTPKLTDPLGFKANAVMCGLKKDKYDLMVLLSEKPAICSAVFTVNTVKAAPVIVSHENIKKTKGNICALITNSGVANAATGIDGINDTNEVLEYLAGKLGLFPQEIVVCSTGVIGKRLDVDKVKNGIDNLVKDLSVKKGVICAEAILTTDLVEKKTGYSFFIADKEVKICGIAKGSGMIAPNMATMLAFITTDILIQKSLLDKLTKECAEETFNCITVDGAMSTNDTVFVMANGRAGNIEVKQGSKDADLFKKILSNVMLDLAKAIVLDGEGATKFIEITVSNAKDKNDAKKIAMAIANSNLVKTALFGEDPNWGRILSAAGSTEVDFDDQKIELSINKHIIFSNGFAKLFPAEIMKEPNINIGLNLNVGSAEAKVYASDLSYDYIKINAEYHT